MSIYLDHNATSPLAPDVRAAMVRLLGEPIANPSSLHAAGRRARELLEDARSDIADCVNADPEQVILCSGGTEANFLALAGTLDGARRRSRMAVSAIEHPSVIESARGLCDRARAELAVLPVLRNGALDVDRMVDHLSGDELLISVMLANHETGAVQPIEEVVSWAREHGVLVHVDAAQAVGRMPVRFDLLRADLLTFSGHKLGAPQGIGAVVMRPGTPLAAFLRGGQQERGLRPGTENVIGAVGLATACRGVPRLIAERERLTRFREHLAGRLLADVADAVRVTPTGTGALCQTLNMVFPKADGEAVVHLLADRGIAVSTGAACSSGQTEPSHVLTAMGYSPGEARSALRFSLGLDISMADIDSAADATREAVEEVRQSYRTS